jgi:hypothetical protein
MRLVDADEVRGPILAASVYLPGTQGTVVGEDLKVVPLRVVLAVLNSIPAVSCEACKYAFHDNRDTHRGQRVPPAPERSPDAVQGT